MIEINFKAENFPTGDPNISNGPQKMHCNWIEILWSSITVGKKGLNDVQYPKGHGIYEIIFRAAMIYATLTQNNNTLYKSNICHRLDPSEKGALSYFQGLMISKLSASKLFNVPWLMHYDVYKNDYIIVASSTTKSRPDLIGVDISGRWFVWEAKGRTNNFDREAQKQAIAQTTTIHTINGDDPYRIACQSYFDSTAQFRFYLTDPSENKKENNIEIDPDRYQRSYYKNIFNFLQGVEHNTVQFSKEEFVVAEVPVADVYIGLEKEKYEAMNNNRISLKEFRTLKMINEKEVYIGQDGVYIKLGESWNEAIFTKQIKI